MEGSKKGTLPTAHGITLSKKHCPQTDAELNSMREVPYASAIGSIMYAMICTRPDVSFALSVTSRYQSDPGMEHWYLLVTLKAKDTSGLVHIMAYMIEPIAKAYGTSLMLSSLAYV